MQTGTMHGHWNGHEVQMDHVGALATAQTPREQAVSMEEYATVGLRGNSKYTENAYIQQMGDADHQTVPLRTNYRGDTDSGIAPNIDLSLWIAIPNGV